MNREIIFWLRFSSGVQRSNPVTWGDSEEKDVGNDSIADVFISGVRREARYLSHERCHTNVAYFPTQNADVHIYKIQHSFLTGYRDEEGLEFDYHKAQRRRRFKV